MPTVRVEAQLTSTDLLAAVRQLSSPELETFVAEVLSERNRRCAPLLDRTEADLFAIVNEGRPEAEQQRFAELKGRLRAKTMTPEEQAEFLQITDQRERQNVRRIEALAALAQHRGVPLRQLMDQLGIKAPADE